MTREPEDLPVMLTRAGLRAEVERLKEQVASLQASSGYESSIAQLEIERLRAAMREACELLLERKYGNTARSPGHNARLVLEAALEPKP